MSEYSTATEFKFIDRNLAKRIEFPPTTLEKAFAGQKWITQMKVHLLGNQSAGENNADLDLSKNQILLEIAYQLKRIADSSEIRG
jgi:hypothetical protein|tara:strand:- start:3 stop:257 length:255 start_codon:yes stop_codon:yes gene_type:complete